MTQTIALAAILFHAAIFGFFYAWICSTIWGLDTLPPDAAIRAMNAMNESVRNAVFAPAFFGTPLVSGLAALLCWQSGAGQAALCLALAAALYLFGAAALTLAVNVPMNEALGALTPAQIAQDADALWSQYSARWQLWNTARTVTSGAALVLAVIGYGQLRAAA